MPIQIVDYRSSWPQEFVRFADALRSALGDIAIRIDHIGSTSVQGLAAKDIIDIQVTTATLNDELLESRLADAGFVWRSDLDRDHSPPGAQLPDVELAKRMVTNPPADRRANIHIRVRGRFNQRYALLCRDYLRSHPLAAVAYGEFKHNLARLVPDDIESYCEIKDPVFDLLMAGAEDWAQVIDWQPGPSDG